MGRECSAGAAIEERHRAGRHAERAKIYECLRTVEEPGDTCNPDVEGSMAINTGRQELGEGERHVGWRMTCGDASSGGKGCSKGGQ